MKATKRQGCGEAHQSLRQTQSYHSPHNHLHPLTTSTHNPKLHTNLQLSNVMHTSTTLGIRDRYDGSVTQTCFKAHCSTCRKICHDPNTPRFVEVTFR